MHRYTSVSQTINPDPLAPAARLAVVVLARVRPSLTSSLTAAEAQAGGLLISVGVVIMLCTLLALVDPSHALWLGCLATMVGGAITVDVDRAGSGMTIYELARDSLGRIQRAALAEPLVYRLSDVLGLPTLADLSIVAAGRQPAPPPPALPACGIALTPRLSPIPVPAPAA
jgi:hypothetical protein